MEVHRKDSSKRKRMTEFHISDRELHLTSSRNYKEKPLEKSKSQVIKEGLSALLTLIIRVIQKLISMAQTAKQQGRFSSENRARANDNLSKRTNLLFK